MATKKVAAPGKRASAAPAKKVATERTGYQIVRMTLSAAHRRILAEEARRVGMQRGKFMEMLLRKSAGIIHFERPPEAPKYTFVKKELEDYEEYAWNCPRDLKPILDTELRRFGYVYIQGWAVHMLNAWIGQAQGLQPATK